MEITTTKQKLFDYAEIVKPNTRLVYLYITSDCFVQNNVPETAGRLLYLDLIMSGAGKYSRDEFSHALDELGSTIVIGSVDGRVTISVKAIESKLGKTLVLLETMLKQPIFSSSELKRAKSTAQSSIELYKEEARALALDNLRSAIYTKADKHFRFQPEEIAKGLAGIKIADIKKLHKRFLDRRWFVTVAGDKKNTTKIFKQITKLKNNYLAELPKEEMTILNDIKATKIITKSVPSKQNIELSIGSPVPLQLPADELAYLIFGIAVLGKWGGFAGRLMSTVREKEGLTYSIYARAEGLSTQEFCYWRIMTFFSPKDVARGLTSTLREINQIATKGITDSEYKRFKTILKTSEILMFDTLAGTASLVHGNMVSGLSYDDYNLFKNTLQTCTKSQVNQALKTYLNPNKLVISAVGPVAEVLKDLQKFGKSK